ncbi:hypothetical protein [Novosphingobium huizhouense]|uniref:hypothetical protein n=1 Tax=Novosphingobium huizhouense TaxID=2866625 RepID=UPI001CD85A41|nr:hypothetical protein [Novosphingobium huizhouense]
MISRRIWPVVGALVLSGCSTIDHGAMVYVSTVKVGVGLSSGTAETPGAKFLIGVDATDAAYVPVTKARHCEVKPGVECKRSDYPITEITGTNETASDLSQLLRDESRKLMEKQAAVESARANLVSEQSRERRNAETLKDFERARAIIETFDATVAGQQADEPPPPLEQSPQPVEEALRSAEPERVAAARNFVKANGNAAFEYDSAKKRAKDAADDLAKAIDAVEDQAESIRQVSGNADGKPNGNRHDALSVYGTFSNNNSVKTGADGVHGDVGLGKSFSTGVAAQILADAKKTSASADCLDHAAQLGKLAPPASAASIISNAIKVCLMAAK